jgi:DNA-binding transcriptional MerR regulator
MSHQSNDWTLTEAARLLEEPQHRLIYLCEKGAVIPDFHDAHGRGSSRRFSARNLLEFALALRLRNLTLPVEAIRAILHTLRAFQAAVRREVPDFDVVESLRRPGAPELRVLVVDGPRVYFALADQASAARLFGGIALPPHDSKRATRIREIGSPTPELGGPAKIEVNVTEIAKSLRLDLR